MTFQSTSLVNSFIMSQVEVSMDLFHNTVLWFSTLGHVGITREDFPKHLSRLHLGPTQQEPLGVGLGSSILKHISGWDESH